MFNLEPTEASEKNNCDDCQACIRACPAKALALPQDDSPYAINKFACRTYRQTGLTCSMCMKACAAVHA
jgi:epoxyqueuosine reductase QueG